ncbi:MAG TPA: ATP-binding protein [Gemmatimonadaceae bacterium]|jgi:signal transduction histidine kinase
MEFEFVVGMNPESRTGDDRRRRNRLEQQRLEAIVDRIADGVLVVDNDGMIKFANPAAEQLFGRSAQELTRGDFGFPVVAADKSEIEVIRPAAPPMTAEVRVVDTEWAGEPAHLVSLRDISDRKRAEERAAELEVERIARAKAEAANQAKSEFLTLMSHELRTPLNAVIGYADLLDLGIGGTLEPLHQQHVSRIRASGRHLLGLVNELLDLAKVESGTLSVHRSIGFATSTISDVLALIRPLADSRRIALTVKSSPVDARYEGDIDRVRQVLVNLFSNAIKFTEPGGEVTIEWEKAMESDAGSRLLGRGPWLRIRVCDTGIGMPAQKLSRIFDPFVQLESSHTRTKEGSGLGLTLSRRLARLMNGDLTVRSAVGHGSTFTLWLREPGADAQGSERVADATQGDAPRRVEGLADVGNMIVRELAHITERFVTRLRSEDGLGKSRRLSRTELADHVGTFVANIGGLLAAIEEGKGQPSSVLADAAQIQSTIADRHGAQRAQLGWTQEIMRREWTILCEEIESVIASHTDDVPEAAIAESVSIVERLIEQANEVSCRAMQRTAFH